MNFCHSEIIQKSYLNLMMNDKISLRLVSSYSPGCFMNFMWDSKLTDCY